MLADLVDPALLQPCVVELIDGDTLRTDERLAIELTVRATLLPVEDTRLRRCAEPAAETLVDGDRLDAVCGPFVLDEEGDGAHVDRLAGEEGDALLGKEVVGVVAEGLVLPGGQHRARDEAENAAHLNILAAEVKSGHVSGDSHLGMFLRWTGDGWRCRPDICTLSAWGCMQLASTGLRWGSNTLQTERGLAHSVRPREARTHGCQAAFEDVLACMCINCAKMPQPCRIC